MESKVQLMLSTNHTSSLIRHSQIHTIQDGGIILIFHGETLRVTNFGAPGQKFRPTTATCQSNGTRSLWVSKLRLGKWSARPFSKPKPEYVPAPIKEESKGHIADFYSKSASSVESEQSGHW